MFQIALEQFIKMNPQDSSGIDVISALLELQLGELMWCDLLNGEKHEFGLLDEETVLVIDDRSFMRVTTAERIHFTGAYPYDVWFWLGDNISNR